MQSLSRFQAVSIKDVQHFWDKRPCNIRHSDKPVGSREYFEEVERKKYEVEPHIPHFAQFDRWNGKSVLEIGCGIGTDTLNFARGGAQVTAVDISPESLKIAETRAQVFGLQHRIRFVLGNAEKLAQVLPRESRFDLIYSFGVLHHTPNPQAALQHLRMFASPGGQLKIMVYHRWSWKVISMLLASPQIWKMDEVIARSSEAQSGCPVTYTFSRSSARRWIEASGFELEDTQINHIFKYRIKEYTRHEYVSQWYFRWMPEWLFKGLERVVGWHLCLNARVPH